MTHAEKRLKSQASVDSAKLQAEIEESLNEEAAANLKSAGKSDVPPSDVVLSEETGERIFVRNENDVERPQSKKVAPIPPPKKSDDKIRDGSDASQERN
ncbi:SAM domain-containing protein [Caerostris extrusa]|uniref:SAM domain-containing protein n=1 Tax=Caerostris extrusa TaxID=172846 RepID=A0AAV4SDA3_CAEEX|nr:SAM domain-containing protein [Caerostris extrusa]